MKKAIKLLVFWPTYFLILPFVARLLLLTGCLVGFVQIAKGSKPRFVFGNIAMTNNVYLVGCTKKGGL